MHMIRNQMIKRIPLDHIMAQGSRYALSRRFEPFVEQASSGLALNLDQAGLLMPVLAKLPPNNSQYLHLIDGFKRYQWACRKGLSGIDVKILAQDFPDLKIATYLAHEHAGIISSTIAAKALFITFCSGLGLENEDLIEVILPAIGLPAQRSLLDKYRRIGALPQEVLSFCHEKSLSFKRCLNLTYHDRKLLAWLMGHRNALHLTATIFQELLDAFDEIMRRKEMSFHDLKDTQDISKILKDEALSASEKTARLRGMLRLLRQPTLTAINADLDKWRCQVEGGNHVLSIGWDRSLEYEHVEIRARITDMAQLEAVMEHLQSDRSLSAINKMLERLKA